MAPRLEAVPNDDEGDRPPPRFKARGVPASATWVSLLAVVVLLALLVVAVVALIDLFF